MDKQFQQLIELERKKDNGAITKSEQTRMDKLIMKYLNKCRKEIEKYQGLLLEQDDVIGKQTKYLTVAEATIKEFHKFLDKKGLLEEYKTFSEQNKMI